MTFSAISLNSTQAGYLLWALGSILLLLGIAFVIVLVHTMLTKRKAMFGPNSKIILKGAELAKDLLQTAGLLVGCFVLATWMIYLAIFNCGVRPF